MKYYLILIFVYQPQWGVMVVMFCMPLWCQLNEYTAQSNCVFSQCFNTSLQCRYLGWREFHTAVSNHWACKQFEWNFSNFHFDHQRESIISNYITIDHDSHQVLNVARWSFFLATISIRLSIVINMKLFCYEMFMQYTFH